MKNNIEFNNEPFTFELVLAERNYKGEPTGRMKESFKTDDIHKLTEHYGRNSGIVKKKKKKSPTLLPQLSE